MLLSDIVFAQRQQYVNLSIPTREDNTGEDGMERKDETKVLILIRVNMRVCVCACVCACSIR